MKRTKEEIISDLQKHMIDVIGRSMSINRYNYNSNYDLDSIKTIFTANNNRYKIKDMFLSIIDRMISKYEVESKTKKYHEYVEFYKKQPVFLLTGQGIASLFLSRLNYITSPIVNDIDLFALQTEPIFQDEANTEEIALNDQSDLIVNDYGLFSSNLKYSIISTQTEQMHNIINTTIIRSEKYSDFSFYRVKNRFRTIAKSVINSFDINSVKIGILFNFELSKIELIVDDEFIKFIQTNQLEMVRNRININTPSRFVKKKYEFSQVGYHIYADTKTVDVFMSIMSEYYKEFKPEYFELKNLKILDRLYKGKIPYPVEFYSLSKGKIYPSYFGDLPEELPCLDILKEEFKNKKQADEDQQDNHLGITKMTRNFDNINSQLSLFNAAVCDYQYQFISKKKLKSIVEYLERKLKIKNYVQRIFIRNLLISNPELLKRDYGFLLKVFKILVLHQEVYNQLISHVHNKVEIIDLFITLYDQVNARIKQDLPAVAHVFKESVVTYVLHHLFKYHITDLKIEHHVNAIMYQINKDHTNKSKILVEKPYRNRIDNISIIESSTPLELQIIGDKMKHCVGGYSSKLGRDSFIYQIERDGDKDFRYTMELDKNLNIVQIRGHSNKNIDENHIDSVKRIIKGAVVDLGNRLLPELKKTDFDIKTGRKIVDVEQIALNNIDNFFNNYNNDFNFAVQGNENFEF